MNLERDCLWCGEGLKGRADKIYCDSQCKAAFHYELRKEKEDSFFKQVDDQLKRNRRLLSHFNKAGKATIRAEQFLKLGFDPNFFTHYWKNKKGDVYLFCYEYGFLKRNERGKEKYVLVKWQKYMRPSRSSG